MLHVTATQVKTGLAIGAGLAVGGAAGGVYAGTYLSRHGAEDPHSPPFISSAGTPQADRNWARLGSGDTTANGAVFGGGAIAAGAGAVALARNSASVAGKGALAAGGAAMAGVLLIGYGQAVKYFGTTEP